jgi:two-component system sensor kinase FixL
MSALKVPEERELLILKRAIDNTNEAFVTIDQEHTVIIFNQAAEKMFGYKREEVIGRDIAVVLSPSCAQNHKAAVARYVETRKPTLIGHETEFKAVRRSGEVFPASISFSVTEMDGRLYFTGLVRDVSETKALQEQVLKAERLAALGQLVAEITHEIKNPLMMIGGFARQLMKTVQEEKSASKLHIIVEEVQRLEELLAGLREIYLPKILNIEKFDIILVLKEVYSLAKAYGADKAVLVQLSTDRDSILVEADRNKLKQVFLNLAKNGIEAMGAGGHLTIRSRLSEGDVEIAFSDDGPGIPKHLQEKIFTPFFTTKAQGSGLGLAVSKKIIDDHPGGSFTLESTEGQGTTVTIRLPVQRSEIKV